MSSRVTCLRPPSWMSSPSPKSERESPVTITPVDGSQRTRSLSSRPAYAWIPNGHDPGPWKCPSPSPARTHARSSLSIPRTRSGSTPNFSTQSSQVSAGGVCSGRLSRRASRSWYGAVRTTPVARSRSSSGTESGSNSTKSSPSSIAYDETSSGHHCSSSHSGCGVCQCQTPGRTSRIGRACPRSLVNLVYPGACGAAAVTWAEPEALHVRFDNEVAAAPVVCHLCPVGFRPEEPSLVAKAVHLLVLAHPSKSLPPPAVVGVERRHQLMRLAGAREDLGIEVGEFVGVFPLVRSLPERDDVRGLLPELDVQSVGRRGFGLVGLAERVLLRILWPGPAGHCRPDICDPRGVGRREYLLLLFSSTAAAHDDRRENGDRGASYGDRHDSPSAQVTREFLDICRYRNMMEPWPAPPRRRTSSMQLPRRGVGRSWTR